MEVPDLTGPCLQFLGEACPGCVGVVEDGFDLCTPNELRGIRASSRGVEPATVHGHEPGFLGSRDLTADVPAARVCDGHADIQQQRSRPDRATVGEVERHPRTPDIVWSPYTTPARTCH